MSESQPRFEFSSKNVVILPQEQKFCTIPISDWQRLKIQIGHIRPPSTFFRNLGFGSVGVVVSAFFALLGFQKAVKDSPSWITILCWTVLVAGLATAIFSFICSRIQHNAMLVSKDHVLAEMKHLEGKYMCSKEGPE